MHRSSRPRSYILRWLLLAVLALLSGCGGSTPPTPAAPVAAAPLPADWQRIELPQAALALPPQWAVTAAEDIDMTAAVAEAAAQNPQLARALEQGQAELASGAVQLIAYDLDPASLEGVTYPTNIRIGRQAYPRAPRLETVAEVNEAELRNAAGFSQVQRADAQVSARPAIRLTSRLQINDSTGNPLALALEQYLLIEGSDVYIITFTTPEGRQAAYRATFDQILQTFRFKPAGG